MNAPSIRKQRWNLDRAVPTWYSLLVQIVTSRHTKHIGLYRYNTTSTCSGSSTVMARLPVVLVQTRLSMYLYLFSLFARDIQRIYYLCTICKKVSMIFKIHLRTRKHTRTLQREKYHITTYVDPFL